MRSLFAAILCLCLMPGVFAADSDFVVKPANPGIVGTSSPTSTNDAPSADELNSTDSSKSSSRTIIGTEKNLVEVRSTPTPPTSPTSTTTQITPLSAPTASTPPTTTSATGEQFIVGNQLPQTGPMETLVIFIACLLSAAIFYNSYRRGSL